ncbi:zinc metalloprotease [Pilimelia terevasa]|uniref:Zinc metalloprotease n=1 Tax=Pilimelia terevasa TaxID=53372 RepID=A0A8J3BST7_9ACTN|nr:zinc metalloprotease [Pilimelia terevasa]GGK35104.1 zinc metalloprotease [Pilimelia terevasa]
MPALPALFAATCAAALLAAAPPASAPTSAPPSAPSAVPPATAAAPPPDCVPSAADARPYPGELDLVGGLIPQIRHPLRAGLTRVQRILREREFARLVRGLTDDLLPRAVTVPVVVHVVSADGRRATGAVSDEMIDKQMDVLNRAYRGGSGSAASPFRFVLRDVNRVVRPEWAYITYGSRAERQMKYALRRGDARTLNLYVSRLGTPAAGWATFPSRSVDPGDGVVLHAETLPGGEVRGYNEGDTAVHEVGHWLNLYHTFEQGCAGEGDHVADTPAEAEPAAGCPVGRDTCAAAGRDPVRNYLDYGHDGCMVEFTPGQVRRMRQAWAVYRG